MLLDYSGETNYVSTQTDLSIEDMQISSYYNNHLAVEHPWVVQERAAMKYYLPKRKYWYCTDCRNVKEKEKDISIAVITIVMAELCQTH